MAVERGSNGWVLGLGLVLCLLGVISVGMGVGAVVPAVGAVFNVEGGGVGSLVGYLVGAVFWGGFGVVALRMWRRAAAKAAVVVPVGARVLAEPVPLPEGPGMVVRWLVAVPLMVAATVLPMFGQLTLSAWHSLSFAETMREFDKSGPAPTFWGEFWHDFGTLLPVVALPGIALVVFLVGRGLFAAWPKTCFWLAVWVLGPATLIGTAVDDSEDVLPNIALAVGLIWLTYELGRLAVWVLTRPVALDVVRSSVEIPYDVPGSRARLRIRRDHVRLDRLKAERGSVRRTIRWPELRRAQLDELDEPTTWQAGAQTRIEVPAGPVLRIVGGNEEWVLPVTEAMGEDLAAAITLRTRNET